MGPILLTTAAVLMMFRWLLTIIFGIVAILTTGLIAGFILSVIFYFVLPLIAMLISLVGVALTEA